MVDNSSNPGRKSFPEPSLGQRVLITLSSVFDILFTVAAFVVPIFLLAYFTESEPSLSLEGAMVIGLLFYICKTLSRIRLVLEER